MNVVAWVLLLPSAYVTLALFVKFARGHRVNLVELITMLISLLIAATSAGIIWGGLLQ